MKTRIATLVTRKTFTASDVIEKDLKGLNPISFIDVIVRMTNGAAMTEASTVKIHDDITKIEISDGGDVLVSANMEELQALNCFEDQRWPYQVMTLNDNGVQTEAVRIPFGFFKWDPNHYLKPADFENLQIKVTVTMTTAAATAWAASGHDVTILAGIMEEGYGDYQGFLATKSVKSYSAVDGTREDVDMNVDYPYRAILIQAFKTATRPDENIEIVKLTCDEDAHVELDLYMTELEALNGEDFGPLFQKFIKRMTNAGDICYSDMFLNTWADVDGGTTLYAEHITSVDCDQIAAESLAQT